MTNEPSEIISSALADRMVQDTDVHLNVGQSTIVITEDKVRLCLMQHLGKLESRRGWFTPAGILLTLLLTFVTTSFKDFVLSASTWEAAFGIAALLAAGWLIIAFVCAWNAPSVDDIVGVMKQASDQEEG